MLIENFHRLSSKAFGFFVIALLVIVLRKFPKTHPLRDLIKICFAFTLIEGLLGAVLVLKGLVGQEESVFRAAIMALHLMNTFLLTGSIVLCWACLKYENRQTQYRPLPKNLKIGITVVIGLWIVVNSTGALAALASTLFPSTDLLEGLRKDFAEGSHFSLRLRILHPIFAVGFVLLGLYGAAKVKDTIQLEWQKNWLWILQILLGLNLIAGLVTLGLLSPTYMKLMHLTFTHLIWVALVLSLTPHILNRLKRLSA